MGCLRNVKDYIGKYVKNDFEINFQVKYRRKKILEIIRKYHPNKILEIGCGMEPIFMYLDLENISHIEIVEPGEEFYRNAKTLILKKAAQEKVSVVQGFLEERYKEIDADYDFILCSGLLHEVEMPEQLLNCIRKISRKDTIVHINVPNAYSLHRILAYKMGLIDDVHQLSEANHVLQQHSVFDLDMLCELVEVSDMQVIDRGSYFCKPFTHQQMYKLWEMEILNEKMLDGFDQMIQYMPQYGSEIYVNAKVNGVE